MGKRLELEWSPRARRDLVGILEYLGSVAGEGTARKVAGRIIAAPNILTRHPFAGSREWQLEVSDKEYRYLVRGHYKIIYYIKNDTVFISTIFDCRQDPEALR